MESTETTLQYEEDLATTEVEPGLDIYNDEIDPIEEDEKEDEDFEERSRELVSMPVSAAMQKEISQNEVVLDAAEITAAAESVVVKEVPAALVAAQYPELYELLTSSSEYQNFVSSNPGADPEIIFRLNYLAAEDLAADTGETLQSVDIIIRLKSTGLTEDDPVVEDENEPSGIAAPDDPLEEVMDDPETVSASYSTKYEITANSVTIQTDSGEAVLVIPDGSDGEDENKLQWLHGILTELVNEGEGAVRMGVFAFEQPSEGDSVFTFSTTVYSYQNGELRAEVTNEDYGLEESIALLESGSPAFIFNTSGSLLSLEDLYARRQEKEESKPEEETVVVGGEDEDSELINLESLPELAAIDDTEQPLVEEHNITHERGYFFQDEEELPSELAIQIVDEDSEGEALAISVQVARPFSGHEIAAVEDVVVSQFSSEMDEEIADEVEVVSEVANEAVVIEETVAEISSQAVEEQSVARNNTQLESVKTEMVKTEIVKKETVELRSVKEEAVKSESTREQKVTKQENKQAAKQESRQAGAQPAVAIKVEQEFKAAVEKKTAEKKNVSQTKTEADQLEEIRYTETVRERGHALQAEPISVKTEETLKIFVPEKRTRETSIATGARAAINNRRSNQKTQVVTHGKKMAAGSGGWQIRNGEGGVQLYASHGAPAHIVAQALVAAQNHRADHHAGSGATQYFLQEADGGYELVYENETITTVTEPVHYARAA